MRQLSLQLIRAQDEERRRFARELHDGLGQTLVGAKIMADTLLIGGASDEQFTELANVLTDAISQTRTISYLFHPPLLDEAGLASAANWLVEGYALRMGMIVSVDIPRPAERVTAQRRDHAVSRPARGAEQHPPAFAQRQSRRQFAERCELDNSACERLWARNSESDARGSPVKYDTRRRRTDGYERTRERAGRQTRNTVGCDGNGNHRDNSSRF